MNDNCIIPECYIDTNLIETLVPPSRGYNHLLEFTTEETGLHRDYLFCLLIWKQIATFAFEVKYDGSKKYKSHIE